MEIEVQCDGNYAKAFVQQLDANVVTVGYENKWKPDEQVPYSHCQAVLVEKPIKSEFKPGDIIEAFYKKNGQQVELWQKVKLRETKGEFAVIEGVENSSDMGIVYSDSLRPLGLAQSLDGKLQQFDIKIPTELRGYFSNADNYGDLLETVAKIHIDFDSDKLILKVSSFIPASIRKVKLLSDIFIADSKQKMALLQRKEEAERALQKSDTGAPIHTEIFTVSSDLIGLSIGTHGANVEAARAIPGIKSIFLDESQFESGQCTIEIKAKNAETAEQARNLLEFVVVSFPVSRDLVGKIIGKSGKTIQDVVDKSGVFRVKINDSPDNEKEVGFEFTGTKEANEAAQLLMKFHIRHLKEIEEVRESVEQMQSKLPPRQQMSNGRPNQRGTTNSAHPNVNANPRDAGSFARRSNFKVPPTNKASQ